MHNIPEEAVKAAQNAIRTTNWEYGITDADMAKALTAALPFLPVQGAVKVKELPWKDTGDSDQGRNSYAQTRIGRYEAFEMRLLKETIYWWSRGYGDEKADSFEAAKAAAQADYEARILSGIEPSAARELALEEVKTSGATDVRELIKTYANAAFEQQGNDIPKYIWHLHFEEFAAAIRSLSSPDHADAGKVEGDGWPTGEYEVDYEVICNGEWVAGSTDLNDAKHYAAVYSQDGKIEIVEARTYRRTLPTPPSSEVA